MISWSSSPIPIERQPNEPAKDYRKEHERVPFVDPRRLCQHGQRLSHTLQATAPMTTAASTATYTQPDSLTNISNTQPCACYCA
jgi:hypothetical protein